MPENLEEAFIFGQWFLNAGEENIEDGEEEEERQKLFSFSQDASLIFAAFHSTHGIDLQEAEMHWWKFLALFMDLGSSTAFCNLAALRKRVYLGTATPEEKAAAREMGAIFEVEQIDMRTPEEKESARVFNAMVEEAKKK